VVLAQLGAIIAFAPPLLALWFAAVLGFRFGAERSALPKPVVVGLVVGLLEVIAFAVYSAFTYPWLGRTHPGPALAGIATLFAPAAAAAAFYLWRHAREQGPV